MDTSSEIQSTKYVNGSETIYALARTGKDYTRCHEFMSNANSKPIRLTFPTVMALRDSHIIGIAATRASDQAVVLGKLLVYGIERSHIVTLRLFQAYENILKMAKVQVYIVAVETGNSTLYDLAEDLMGEPYSVDDKHAWFKRELSYVR